MNHFAPCSCTQVSSCSLFLIIYHATAVCRLKSAKVQLSLWWHFVFAHLSWSDLWLLPPITVTWLSFFCRLFLFIFVIAYLCILIHTLNRKPAQNRCTFTIFCRFNGHVCCCFLSFFLRIMVYKHCVWNCTFSVGLPLICDIQVVQFILTNFA